MYAISDPGNSRYTGVLPLFKLHGVSTHDDFEKLHGVSTHDEFTNFENDLPNIG